MPPSRHDRFLFEEFTGFSILKAVLVAVPALALVALSLWAAVQFLDPMPPRRIVLATGPEGSSLHALGTRYAELMRREGIDVELRPTRGSGENVELLADDQGGVVAGFVVAGTATPDQARRLFNASNLFHVPLLCVARWPSPEITLAGLKGMRLAVGAHGSGVNAWLAPLLAVNGLTPENTQLHHSSLEESVRALGAGELDAVFFGEGAASPGLIEALALPGTRLMSFPRAEAYARRFSHIVVLGLPAGTLDLARGIPERGVTLIGTTVMMATRADVHPTVVDLLVDAARELHSAQGLFQKRGEFPHLHAVDDVAVSEQALLYAREGPSLLRRYLPLWAADALQRVLILAVPLLAVAVPVVRYLPGVLDLLGRRRLFISYAGLRRVERRLRSRTGTEPVDDLLRELEWIEESVAGMKESVLRAGELYTFRVHLRVVREAVLAAAAVRAARAPAQARFAERSDGAG